MNEFKVMFKKRAKGRIEEEKPSATTPRSSRGGKFNVPIFS